MTHVTGANYTYQSLANANSIRLLDLEPGYGEHDIHVSLRHVDLSDGAFETPHYCALSYTWGSPLDQRSPIIIEGSEFPVRPNLLSALRALRHTTVVKTLWIDAVCINQENVPERNNQVSLMAKIYKMAQKVVVWLGNADANSEMAINMMKDKSSANNVKEKLEVAFLHALNATLRRDYWFRAWIIQEVRFACDVEIQCGSNQLSWSDFASTCTSLQKHLSNASSALRLVEQRVKTINNEISLREHTLESLVRTYCGAECTDRRDRIFAFLSLASDCSSGYGLRADYRLSRLALLVKTLEFCQPDDPVDFVSILFKALTKPEADKHWCRTADTWEQVRLDPPVFGYLPNDGVCPSGTAIKVTQFKAAESSRHDWARQDSKDAYRETPLEESNSTNADTHNHKFRQIVNQIDDSDIVVRLHERHLVVFSTLPFAVMFNPCFKLKLHKDASRCIWGRCLQLIAST